MFRKDDYIVVLDIGDFYTACAKNNYIFKQKENNNAIYPVCDLNGNKNNGNSTLTFDKNQSLKDWRYALPHEIEAYEQAGKPIDVTKLTTEPQYKYTNVYDIYTWICRCIQSCENPIQLCSANKLIRNFEKMFGQEYLDLSTGLRLLENSHWFKLIDQKYNEN